MIAFMLVDVFHTHLWQSGTWPVPSSSSKLVETVKDQMAKTRQKGICKRSNPEKKRKPYASYETKNYPKYTML